MATPSLTGTRPGTRPRLQLRVGARRAILVTHIVSAGAWIGVDVMVAVLALAGWTSDDPATRGAAYQALGSFVVWPMLVSGLVCLSTGLLLGLGTKWGLARYWWVMVKLVITVALCALIIGVLRPGMAEVDAAGRDIAAGTAPMTDLSFLAFPPTVSLTALSLAVVLSVYKPWKRIRRADAPTGSTRRRGEVRRGHRPKVAGR